MAIRDHLPTPPPPPAKDSDDGIISRIYDGSAGESTDSPIRYAGYGMRIRTLLSAAHRYVAYTSDIGESFRPVTHPVMVRAAYGVSWAYITGDVAYEGYKAYLNNKAVLAGLPPPHPSPHHHHHHPQHPLPTSPSSTSPPNKIPFLDDYRTLTAQRLLFQSLASMALPAFTIHSVVRYSGRAMKDVKNARLRTWGPVGLGLAVVPALPYLFDAPVEWAVERGAEVLAGVLEGGGRGTADKEGGGGRREL